MSDRRALVHARHCILCGAGECDAELITDRNSITSSYTTWCRDVDPCRRRHAASMGDKGAVIAVRAAAQVPAATARVWMVTEHDVHAWVPDVLGCSAEVYAAAFERTQLSAAAHAWDRKYAVAVFDALLASVGDRVRVDRFVLLGIHVGFAARISEEHYEPFKAYRLPGSGASALTLPHPKARRGLQWNEENRARARQSLAQFAPHLAPVFGVEKEKAA